MFDARRLSPGPCMARVWRRALRPAIRLISVAGGNCAILLKIPTCWSRGMIQKQPAGIENVTCSSDGAQIQSFSL